MAVDNYALGQRDGAIASARAWEEYAHKLEQAIISLRKGEAGQIALKKAALNELAKQDPKNALLDVNYRKKIYDYAYSQPQTVTGK